MGLHAAPRQNAVDQAARWLLEKQQELIMGRAVHGIEFDVKLPLLPAKVNVPSLHSPLSFAIFLAYSITFSVTYPPCSFSYMTSSGKS